MSTQSISKRERKNTTKYVTLHSMTKNIHNSKLLDTAKELLYILSMLLIYRWSKNDTHPLEFEAGDQ